ncbi:16S rRNA (guanine(966)-N(2))-methyltransferase RsmD [Marinivivus vitaminiproducens]|uniref:16S rRNA (guanine(966)-N(2))-methyltransferase RsmD n=1 Tax=Marinivivus vitaminiproducens TaxID=3035935 RepID=UPI0027A9F1C6|nr:16S rRNA (guanine(966)-N(2))-methyltransferase RsmD [Geminicoccaceae bacterium SCSIO 64248]
MRIIAGELRGRTLLSPKDRAIRPTADRAREALFNMLAHGEDAFEGCRFLDLFAGTGAVGFEAVSRGARHVLAVDDDPAAVRLVQENARKLGVAGRYTALRRDATRLGRADAPFDVAFLDPPYGEPLAAPALQALRGGGWLADGALVILELSAKERAETAHPGFAVERERRYGAGRFLFLREETA